MAGTFAGGIPAERRANFSGGCGVIRRRDRGRADADEQEQLAPLDLDAADGFEVGLCCGRSVEHREAKAGLEEPPVPPAALRGVALGRHLITGDAITPGSSVPATSPIGD